MVHLLQEEVEVGEIFFEAEELSGVVAGALTMNLDSSEHLKSMLWMTGIFWRKGQGADHLLEVESSV